MLAECDFALKDVILIYGKLNGVPVSLSLTLCASYDKAWILPKQAV